MTRSISSTISTFALLPLFACSTQHEPRIVGTDARGVEVVTAGSGPTTVIFEAGLGDGWTTWDEVMSEVELGARVFAYSRPGYGDSAPAVTERDPLTIVQELRTLLAAEGQRPPYVLVGHSNGGGYMELFAKAHPDEVIGVVLVDPRHRDFLTNCTEVGIDGCGIPDSMLQSLPPVEAAEYRGYAKASEQIGAAGAFGATPVRVLTATEHPVSREWEELWQSMLAALAVESADGEQIPFSGAGHYLHTERPHDVARAILDLVPAVSR